MSGRLKPWCHVLISMVLLHACSSGPKDINKDEDIETADFISAFPEKPLPIQFQQKDLLQKESDSFFVKSNSLFSQNLFADITFVSGNFYNISSRTYIVNRQVYFCFRLVV